MLPGWGLSSEGRELHVVVEDYEVFVRVVPVCVRCHAACGGDDARRLVHDASLGQADDRKHESIRRRSGILFLRRDNYYGVGD